MSQDIEIQSQISNSNSGEANTTVVSVDHISTNEIPKNIPEENTFKINDTETVKHVEAILFWRGDPMNTKTLSKIIGVESVAIESALKTLKTNLSKRGIVLIEHDGEYTLGTNPESAELIEKVRTEELSKDLGKASLETLAIILYQGPIRRSEIDYIRGVNSNFILRNLLVRGLIERKTSKDSRTPEYNPTLELLRFLGISHVFELDDFEQITEAIQTFRAGDIEGIQSGLNS